MSYDNDGTDAGEDRDEASEGTATEQQDDVGEGTESTDADESEPDEASDSTAGSGDEDEEIQQEMERIQEDPPKDLDDWPQGKAMYETFGGPEGEHGYHEGPEQKLGPSSLRHHEGGDVSIEGEKVDDPDEYKGEPIPGGPTDQNAPDAGDEREKETEDDGDD